MHNISIIGCGNWSEKIISEIKKNKFFRLENIVCRHKNKSINFNINKLNKIDELFCKKNIGSVYVAALPDVNLEVIKYAKINKIPLILEKPISTSYQDSLELMKIAKENEIVVLPNMTNYFSECFSELEKFIKYNYEKINKIIIFEGAYGPFRNKIHPIWDWGFHSISTLVNLFQYENFSNITHKEIKKNNDVNGNISKFSFTIDNKINVKIITGNLFKRKSRVLKIFLKGNESLVNDMVQHKLFFNEKEIYSIKKSNLNFLLDIFNLSILKKNLSLSQKLLDNSAKTTKILENFYKY